MHSVLFINSWFRSLFTYISRTILSLQFLEISFPPFHYYKLQRLTQSILGDGPAIADLIGMKRPGNALVPCRFCRIKGQRGVGKTYYIPHTAQQLLGDLPMRTDLCREIDLCCTIGKPTLTKRGMYNFRNGIQKPSSPIEFLLRLFYSGLCRRIMLSTLK